MFAVRALKNALFGTPAPRERRAATKTTSEKPAQQNADRPPPTDKSPAKPPGILLTPGTGTSRRKRVSFGHDVKQGSGGPARSSTSGLPDECPGKFPSPWVERSSEGDQPRPKTKLQQAMENSRRNNGKEGGTDVRDFASPTKELEDIWEEVGDDSENDADVTTDLNEPHSRSGKYWKSYFESYHTDAKAEMEKLVKYKQLAKSYAKMKDAEALELGQKLKEEQEKVKALEEQIAELNRKATLPASRKGGEFDRGSADELEKQTALALEYKKRVEELEAQLKGNADEPGEERRRQRRAASPRTQQTLMETQRELRRARSQIRELEKLREERDRLRSELKLAEQRASDLADENKKMSAELSQSTSRIRDLEKSLEESKGVYDKLKEDAKARYVEAQQVLQKKNEKISELEEEIESLKKERAEQRWSTRSTRAKSLDEKAATAAPPEPAEEGRARLLKDLQELRRTRSQREQTAAALPAETRYRETRDTEGYKRATYDDATLASSRALREKLEAEFGTKAQPISSVLADRGNLQDSRSSASSGRPAQPRDEGSQPNRTDRASRLTRTATAADALGDVPGDSDDKRTSKTSSQEARILPARPPTPESEAPGIDLVRGRFARLGGADAQASAAWSPMKTSRSSLPAERRAAAIARLQRKKAERALQRLGPNKENARPS